MKSLASPKEDNKKYPSLFEGNLGIFSRSESGKEIQDGFLRFILKHGEKVPLGSFFNIISM